MFARTERLTLRPGWPEDAPALADAIGHEAVARRLARVPWPYTLDHARDFLAAPARPGEPQLVILAHEPTGTHLIGGIGLMRTEDAHELGYWLTPRVWGRGYASEAARALLAAARTGLGVQRVVASHHRDNPASGRVLAKLGFRPIAHAARYSAAQGRTVPSVQLGLDLADEDAFVQRCLPIAA